MKSFLVLLLLTLTGCYSVVSINLGSVQHQAASSGPLMPPEVQCAALAGEAIKAGNVEAEQMEKTCADITASQVAGEKKAKK
jgi:hypothetical protein